MRQFVVTDSNNDTVHWRINWAPFLDEYDFTVLYNLGVDTYYHTFGIKNITDKSF